MEDQFNAVEVFRIAEQVERDGAEFYRQAAELSGDMKVSAMFHELADWERVHEITFTDMRRRFCRNELSVSSGSNDHKAVAALNLFAMELNPAHESIGNTDLKDVLKTTIKNEYGTVKYYNALKNFVKDRIALEQISKIIKEEKQHIEMLNQLILEM